MKRKRNTHTRFRP